MNGKVEIPLLVLRARDSFHIQSLLSIKKSSTQSLLCFQSLSCRKSYRSCCSPLSNEKGSLIQGKVSSSDSESVSMVSVAAAE